PGRVPDQRFNGVVLAESEFEDQISSRAEPRWRAVDQPRDDLQSVAAAEEGDLRLVIAHLRLQTGPVPAGDVGRITHDEIDRIGDRIDQIPAYKPDPIG